MKYGVSGQHKSIQNGGIAQLFGDMDDGLTGKKRCFGGSFPLSNQQKDEKDNALMKVFFDYEGYDEEIEELESEQGIFEAGNDLLRSCRWASEDSDEDQTVLHKSMYGNGVLIALKLPKCIALRKYFQRNVHLINLRQHLDKSLCEVISANEREIKFLRKHAESAEPEKNAGKRTYLGEKVD